jgi:hypothetical protein
MLAKEQNESTSSTIGEFVINNMEFWNAVKGPTVFPKYS